eukprot:252761-Chlamydomonas_euryale.AAC.1
MQQGRGQQCSRGGDSNAAGEGTAVQQGRGQQCSRGGDSNAAGAGTAMQQGRGQCSRALSAGVISAHDRHTDDMRRAGAASPPLAGATAGRRHMRCGGAAVSVDSSAGACCCWLRGEGMEYVCGRLPHW